MKKFVKGLMLATAATLFAASVANAQEIVVRTRPVYRGHVVVRGVAPSPRHAWVSEEWTPVRGRYVYHPAHWEEHPGGVWIAGHWDRRPGGQVWIAGHWR